MTAAVLVVADDFTGANAAAAGFARAGLRAVTISGDEPSAALAEFSPRFDVVVVSTDSRHSTPTEAASRITEVIEAAWPINLVCNRIDTTLRGNVATTTAAALATVRRLSGRRVVAICSPAHPEGNRYTVDGMQLLYGQRLERTELAKDALNPMTTSDVAELILGDTGLRGGHVPLRAITGPRGELIALIRSLLSEVDVLIVDAIDTDHLELAAAAAVEAGSEVLWLAVDPGPGSLALARALGFLEGRQRRPATLAVCGSATALTRAQLRRLMTERSVRLVRPTLLGVGIVDVTKTAEDTQQALAAASLGEVVLVATAVDDADVVPIPPAQAAHMARDLGLAARRAMQAQPVAGLYSSGGDVAAALLSELRAPGLEVEREIVPLAVAGTIVGGAWDGLPVVTKGGFVGDTQTVVACIKYLEERAEQTRQHVLAGTEAILMRHAALHQGGESGAET